jgi:hypothetical protein
VLLSLTQLGDSHSQGHQVRDQRDGDQRGVTGDLTGQCHQPGSADLAHQLPRRRNFLRNGDTPGAGRSAWKACRVLAVLYGLPARGEADKLVDVTGAWS